MEESVLLEPDINEGGFEAVFEVAHLAFENAADQALFGRPFDGEFLEPAFLDHAHAGFERFRVDDDFLVDLLDRLDQPLDLFDQRAGRGPDGFHDSLGLLLDGNGLERLLFLHLGGGCEVRLAEIPLPRLALGRFPCGNPSGGRPAAMFSARSIS